MMNLYELHHKMTAHLFQAFSNTDERFLALALCGEAGELANMIKKRWRDNVDLGEEIRDEIADVRIYLELIAKCFGIEGEKLDAHVDRLLRSGIMDINSWEEERFISMALCNRIGVLAGIVESRWRANTDTILIDEAREQ